MRREGVSVMSACGAVDLDNRISILVAIEPRSYRTAIGQALQILRPHVVVGVTEPEELMAEISRVDPDLVISGRSRPVGCGMAWMEFRPYDQAPARVRIGGRCVRLVQPGLGDLLRVVDEVDSLERCPR